MRDPQPTRIVVLGGGFAGIYAVMELERRLGRDPRVEITLVKTKVAGFSADGVALTDGTMIPTANLVWTAGTAPNPLLAQLACRKERGRVVVDEFLQVAGWPGVWSLGDCACVPDKASGGVYPPTAQHASRE